MSHHEVHLEHVLLDIADLERSLPFYRHLFPTWTLRWEGRTDKGGRWVHFGPVGGNRPGYLSLHETARTDVGASNAGSSLRIEHVGFEHPDVEALVARLQAASVRPNDRVDDGKFRRVYFVDPDGHELEFVQKLMND